MSSNTVKVNSAPTAAQTPSNLTNYHTEQFHEVISDFFLMNEADELCDHLTHVFADFIGQEQKDGTSPYDVSYLKEAAFQNAEIVTFFVRLERSWVNYRKFVLDNKEVCHA